eukprot:162415_1
MYIIKGEYNRKWNILYFDDNFPIPNGIIFNNDREKDMFIGCIFEYCYMNKRRPQIKDMKYMMSNIRNNDISVKIRERYMCIQEEEKKVYDIEINNKQRVNTLGVLKSEIENEEYEIEEMFRRIERMKQRVNKKKIMVESEERNVYMRKKDIKNRKRRLKLERDIYEKDVRDMDMWSKDNGYINERRKDICVGMERCEKLKIELVECVNKRKERVMKNDIMDNVNDVCEVKVNGDNKGVMNDDNNPYLDSELANVFEKFSPNNNKQFEEKYNKCNVKNEEVICEDDNEVNGNEECVTIEEVICKDNEVNNSEECVKIEEVICEDNGVNDNEECVRIEEIICEDNEVNDIEECEMNNENKLDDVNSDEINNDLKYEMNDEINMEREIVKEVIEEKKEEIINELNENMDDINKEELKSPKEEILNNIQTNINDMKMNEVDLITKDEIIENNNSVPIEVSSNDSSPKYACAKVMKMAMNYISPIVEPPSESDTSEHTISQVNSPITENKNENELNDEINDEIWQQEANKYFAKTENVLIQILCTQQFNLLIKARRDVLRLYDEYAEKKISENKHNREYHAVLRWQKTNIDEIVNHDIRYIEDLQYMRQRYVSQIESNNYHIDINQEFAAKQQIKTWKQQRNYLINDTKNAHLLQTLHNNNNISEMSKKEMAYRKSSIETIDQFIKTLEENDIYDEIKENNNEIYSNIYTDKKIEIVEKKMFNNEYFAKRHFEQTEKKQWQVFKQFQQHINKLGVQTVIAGFNTGKINHKIKELICEGKLFVDVGKKVDMNSFRNCTVGKKFKKEKCELNDFQFKIYLYPNIGNNCVQFTIKLQQIPIEVESVVIYMQLYEKKTGTHFHITNIFNDIGREIGWSNQLLSMKDCLNHKKLQFGYKIQILRISYNDKMKAINDYCKDGLLTSDKLNWTWQLNKNIISSFQQCVGKRKLLVFYHKNIRNTLTGGSFCVSLSSVPQTKNNNIAITLHIFKLPPKTEKLQILFEFDVKKPNIKHRKIEILDYNMNSCTIELNKKESMGLLSVGSGVKLNFKVKFIKMWFRDFMDTPYMQGLNGENNSNMNGNNNFKTTSPKKCKSVKSSKNGKNVKRVNGNHKQRKRNNKKGKTKTK